MLNQMTITAVPHRRRATMPVLAPRRRGWPKTLDCPYCGRPRNATHPGDRFHDGCRARAAELDTGPLAAFSFER